MKNVHIIKRTPILLLIAALLLSLCACSQNGGSTNTHAASTPGTGEPSMQVSEVTPSTDPSVVSPEVSETETQTPSSPAVSNTPVVSDTPVTSPAQSVLPSNSPEGSTSMDFLNSEQIDLYAKTQNMFKIFRGDPGSIDTIFPLPDGTAQTTPPPGSQAAIDGGTYFAVLGKYQKWDDFQAMCLSLFTQEYFNSLNASLPDGSSVFVNVDGYTYYAFLGVGSISGYVPPDTFELVSKTDTEINFTLIGHYAEIGTYDSTGKEPITTETYPITMVKTDNGWRFSQFHLALFG